MSEPPHPGPPDPPAPSRGQAHRSRAHRIALTALIVVVALLGVWISSATGRLDSALLFVGVPCLLAYGVALVDDKGGWGSVVQAVTIVLLLVSALLHEGALCVLLAAPLVYGAAGLIYYASRSAIRGRYALVPVVVMVALEGVAPGARVDPAQSASATAVVAGDCAAFAQALERGPRIDHDRDRGRLLRLAKYPTPVSADGDGLDVGDTWTLRMPAGAITTEVVESRAGRVEFAVTQDTARTTRWVDLQSGALAWRQTIRGCEATLTIDYRRALDPSWWFGPVTGVFMDAGAVAFLSSLD